MARLDFGLQIEPQYGFGYEGIRGIAAEAERLGFESLWVSDCFFLSHAKACGFGKRVWLTSA